MNRDELEKRNVGENLDSLMNLDPRGYGVCRILYAGSRKVTGEPLTMHAAQKLTDTVKPGDLVYILTGFVLLPHKVPEMDGIKLKDSQVHIKGSKYDLDTMKAKNILLRRQKHFRFSAVCKLCMPELYPGQNCGMTCYYDENTYIKFGVFATLEETPRLMLNVVEKIGDEVITHEGVCVDNSNKDIYLKIDTNNLRRTFSYSYNDKDYNKVVTLDNVYYPVSYTHLTLPTNSLV